MNKYYTLQNFKQIFDNNGNYSFSYKVEKKYNNIWSSDDSEYFNIIVEIKDKNNDYIFYTDDNVFDLKIGEHMICNMCLDILIGDYNIHPENFNFNINIEQLEHQFLNSVHI